MFTAQVDSARADYINTTDIPVTGTTPTGGFTATLNASGTATVSGSGSINLGTVFGLSLGTQGFSLSQQTVPVNLAGGAINVGTSPTGNVSVSYINNPSTIAGTSINSADIQLLGGSSVPVNFNPVTLNISTSVIGIGITLGLNLNVDGSLNLLEYVGSSTGTISNPTNPEGYGIPGTFNIGANVQATGSTSILGIGVNLGTLLNQNINESGVNLGIPLPGIMTLGSTPTGTPGLNNLTGNFELPNLGLNINEPINYSGTINETGSSSGSLGSLHDLSLNYSLALQLSLSNISYNVSGSVPNAMVPEASTLLMTGIACSGLIGMGIRSYRRRKAS